MFWKRKVEIVQGPLGPLSREPEPANEIFTLMLDLLRDAEKWNNQQEYKITLAILKELEDVIQTYRNIHAKCDGTI